jgi:arylsulfatase
VSGGGLNVLLITADQHRGDFLGCAGHQVVRTPHLDALGATGAYFSHAYSPVPQCVPARYSWLTGQVPIRFGVRSNVGGGRLPSGAVPLSLAFARAGYATAAIGKMHFTPWHDQHGFDTFIVSEEGRRWNDPHGPDQYQRYLQSVGWGGYERAHGIGNNDVRTSPAPVPLEHYHTTWCARTMESWLRTHVQRWGPDGRPFFAWCSFTKPHSPYDPPEPYDRLYDPRTFPPPLGDARDLEGLSPSYQESRNRHLFSALGPEQIQRARAFYAGNVTLIDEMVGALRHTLAELGIADRTVVCYTADHGDLLGDHGLFFKGNYFRGSWHVPFLLYAPGKLESLGRLERFVTTQDLYPTLLALAGVPLPDGCLDGGDVTADLRGGPDIVFGSNHRAPHQIHAARTRRWSYVVHPRGVYEELYDLAADPDERHNLLAEPAAAPSEARQALETLRAGLEAWLGHLGDHESLDEAGHLRLDPQARGWTPSPEPPTAMGLRPY